MKCKTTNRKKCGKKLKESRAKLTQNVQSLREELKEKNELTNESKKEIIRRGE